MNIEPPKDSHDYDLVVGAMTRQPSAVIVKTLAGRWPKDFSLAWQTLDQTSRIILLHATKSDLFRLARPRFNATAALLDQLHDPAVEDLFATTPIGKQINIHRCFRELQQQVENLDINSARAAWAGLAHAQDPETPDEERLLDRWLDPYYLAERT